MNEVFLVARHYNSLRRIFRSIRRSRSGLRYASLTSAGYAADAPGVDPAVRSSAAAPSEFPARLEIDSRAYPDCREDYLAQGEPHTRAVAISRCTERLDQFYRLHMLPYREASGPGGARQAAYRAIEARYSADRAYLADRFCFNTGCNGYAVPATTKGSAKQRQGARLGMEVDLAVRGGEGGDRTRQCRRGGGQPAGGFAGGVDGGAAKLDGRGVIMSVLLGAGLSVEIACRLDEEERKAAANATLALIKRENLGATAAWISPTREGVSGSSTITGLGTQPNGKRCLSINDIAIIDG